MIFNSYVEVLKIMMILFLLNVQVLLIFNISFTNTNACKRNHEEKKNGFSRKLIFLQISVFFFLLIIKKINGDNFEK